MKTLSLCAAALLFFTTVHSQILMTKKGVISFHSHTILENVDAENKNVMAVIDAGKKHIAFSMLMKQFVFPKKLMQQHFNENYVESDKFPKATFSGSYAEDADITKDGTYSLTVTGKLTIHGVTRDVTIPSTLTVQSGTVTGATTFKLNPTDYEIDIPFIVRNKIEKENTVKVNVEWKQNY
ncbi:MAG: YceI family protein [Chitinophagaceae bacterium]|nr:YceI family protein [Chitinophagaceae bacterium]